MVSYLTTLNSDVQMCKQQQNKVSLNIETDKEKQMWVCVWGQFE